MGKNTCIALCLFWLLSPISAYCNNALSPERQRLKEVYTSQIGILEKTNHNDGKDVHKYLAFCGLKEGNEWCSAFVSWCFDKAGIHTRKTAWAASWYDNRHTIYKHGWQKPKQTPQAGDLVLYYIHSKHRIGHVGFFDSYGTKYCITVEGNTNVGGHHGVHRIKRYWNSFYAIVDRIDN